MIVNFVPVIREATFQRHLIESVISGSKEAIPISQQDTQSIEINCTQNFLGLSLWFHISIFKKKLTLNACMCYRLYFDFQCPCQAILYTERRSASENCIIDNMHCIVKKHKKCSYNVLHKKH